jgi:aminopeptidase N
MQNTHSPIIRLTDYAPSNYLIETVDLDFNLEPNATIVRAKLVIVPNPLGVANKPLVLDGDELELVSIKLNNAELQAVDYSVKPQSLTLYAPPQTRFTLEINTKINPEANTKLMGLYRSNGIYCTQCEAEGFRRITYFLDRPDVMAVYTVRLEADKAEAPILLGNGNPVLAGDVLNSNRHFAVWHDPHPKPAYLFAIVAGDLGAVSSNFTTMTGKAVDLNVYVEKGKEDQADYAMDALKRSMRWDETAFGREYDLDVFNIVAVSDFNMGAMENKGLNIFNDKYILATPDTATDQDYANIEAIVAHEYFHNWTGNRITCRDWFQLCLKEGLTVFRDQEFSSDMRSRAVKRIEDVIDLRERQFGEDAGPLAHAVRPEAYSEINNFYTATIYEKGAELIRMLKILLGDAVFKTGMDLYFVRHDGHAATIEEFIACFAESSGKDLSQFFIWYGQAGTPVLSVKRVYDEAARSLRLEFSQSQKPTPSQDVKKPVVIPIALAMIDTGGQTQFQVFVLDKAQASLTLAGVNPTQVPSILRGFSAPVVLETDLSDADYGVLAAHDTDAFNRWQSIQTLELRRLVARSTGVAGNNSHIIIAFKNVLETALHDPAFAAFALKLPSCQEIARSVGTNINPDAIYAARKNLQSEIGLGLLEPLLALHEQLKDADEFTPDAASAGRRALNTAVLGYIAAAKPEFGMSLLQAQFASATNMTTRIASLALLSLQSGAARENAFDTFEKQFEANPLVLDKWFAVQASIQEPETLERIQKLMSHKAYSRTNPNRIRSVVGTFAFSNFTQFNRADGAGYDFVAGQIIEIDKINPQVSARMATAFRTWRMLEPVRRELAEKALRNIQSAGELSVDLKDIIERSLA